MQLFGGIPGESLVDLYAAILVEIFLDESLEESERFSREINEGILEESLPGTDP